MVLSEIDKARWFCPIAPCSMGFYLLLHGCIRQLVATDILGATPTLQHHAYCRCIIIYATRFYIGTDWVTEHLCLVFVVPYDIKNPEINFMNTCCILHVN